MPFLKDDVIKVNQYIYDHKKIFNKEIGSRIKHFRKTNDVTIEEFSEKSLMNINQLSHLENGKNGITLNKFIIICNSLGCNPNTLLEPYMFSANYNDDLFYYEIQQGKNLSKNLLNYIILKK